MNRFEMLKQSDNVEVFNPLLLPLHQQPISIAAKKINEVAASTSMDEWIRIRNAETRRGVPLNELTTRSIYQDVLRIRGEI